MRKTLRLLSYILSVAFVVGIVSCSKDGPAGPAGATGPAGPAGAAGAAGPAGPTGTANVIYSDWDTTATWIVDTVHNGATIDTVGYHANLAAPKLDTTILNRGEVKVYVNANTTADPVVFAVPYNDGLIFIDAVFFTGTIQLVSNVKLTGVPFRYILIPGGTHARTTKVNWNNYSEVKAYLGLKD
ncbi:MAG TPA: hypothetical protein VFD24_02040 [Chitinophagaceae bacterium]|jgi:hypothetical protein|nr:hypothetical protein [Chitinophagaceae bacterium]